MQAALEWHLKSKLYPKSIIKDREFFSSRKVLEGKARKLREGGRGKPPNRSKSLTNEEEETLWKSGQFGSRNPRALINTMWWLLTQQFGLRGRQEHHNMKVEDFCLQRDDDGWIPYFRRRSYRNEARRAKGQTPTGYTEDVCHRQWGKMPCNVVQGLPGETMRGNENHRPVLRTSLWSINWLQTYGSRKRQWGKTQSTALWRKWS